MPAEQTPGGGRPQPRPISSLVLNVAALFQESIGAVREYEIADAPFEIDGSATSLRGRLRLLRTDRTILASASLAAPVPDVCAACLEPISLDLALEFDEEFWPSRDPFDGSGIEIPPEREGFPIIDSEIDLAEPVRQYALMARPMSPRCGGACPGAAGLAEAEPPMDDRWAPLLPLRAETGGSAAAPR